MQSYQNDKRMMKNILAYAWQEDCGTNILDMLENSAYAIESTQTLETVMNYKTKTRCNHIR